MPPLSIVLNPSVSRIKTAGMSTLVSGKDWAPNNYPDLSGIWVDWVTYTAMLQPNCWNSNWSTTNSGSFTKLGLTDFTLTPAATSGPTANWQAQNQDAGGPFMVYNGTNPGCAGITNTSFPANQPMVVEWFANASTDAPYVIFECGWNTEGGYTGGVALRFFSDGNAQVWKDGVLVGSYTISGQNAGYFTQQPGSPPRAAKGHYVTTALIPCRDRELLVASTMGGGFAHIFDDLAENQGGLTITDAAPFWFNIPGPVTVIVRIAPLVFANSGTIYGALSGWPKAPPSDTPDGTKVYRDITGSGGAVCTATTGGTSNPYGIPYPVQLQVALTGGGSLSPFVYGCRAWYNPVTAETSDEAIDVTDYVVSASLNFSDTIGGKAVTFTLNKPAELESLMGASLIGAMGIPVQISDSSGLILMGTCDVPTWIDGANPDETDNGFSADNYDLQQMLEFRVRDNFKIAEEFNFTDPIPLDGETLSDAITKTATWMGLNASVSSSANDFKLPVGGIAAGGNWNFLCEVGDKGSEILDRLHKTYAADWYFDISADGDVIFTDPSDFPETSSLTLYQSISKAIAAGYSEDEAYQYVVKGFKYHVLEPEGTDIYVLGTDFRTQKPILYFRNDSGASDPTTPFASRPANWIGKIKTAGWFDPSITTIAAAQYTMGILFPKLTSQRGIVEFDSEYLDGIPQGTLVTLDGYGILSSPVRIKTFSGEFVQIGDQLDTHRPHKYIGEVGPLVCPLGVHGTNIEAVKRNWAVKQLSKYNLLPGIIEVARRPAINVQSGT